MSPKYNRFKTAIYITNLNFSTKTSIFSRNGKITFKIAGAGFQVRSGF
jgi:hypothetical protein